MTPKSGDFSRVRSAIASIPGDLSNDAVGAHVAALEDIYAPEAHAAALAPNIPIVVGARGTGKSFWAGVLGHKKTRVAVGKAYPKLSLDRVTAGFGYTGAVGGQDGISREELDEAVPLTAGIDEAKAFWWASVLSVAARDAGDTTAKPKRFMTQARNSEQREALLNEHEKRLLATHTRLLIIYDALDAIGRTWPRRRLLTEALLEVIWGLRAYRALQPKLFIRSDQIDDDQMSFVELPKLRAGAVRLTWSRTDLYGLFFTRIALAQDPESREAFDRVLAIIGLRSADMIAALTRSWSLTVNPHDQQRAMALLAGPYMGEGTYGYKKGSTYSWPCDHLADSHDVVTPRSFLGMMTAAASYGTPPDDQAITAEGIRHGLRAASKTRVDQLHQEFPWIKGVLATLDGLLLPQPEQLIFEAWKLTKTVEALKEDAQRAGYLLPFPDAEASGSRELLEALEHIGVLFRRADKRLDMPDLFRVAARLLKKGVVTPFLYSG